jgi:hypothetical protein
VTINSPELDSVRCPSDTTLRIGCNFTCTGTYTIKEWDLQRSALYFNVQGDSPTLREQQQMPYGPGMQDGAGVRQARIGPTVVLYMLGNSQLHLDVLASSCRRVALGASEYSWAAVLGLPLALNASWRLTVTLHPLPPSGGC